MGNIAATVLVDGQAAAAGKAASAVASAASYAVDTAIILSKRMQASADQTALAEAQNQQQSAQAELDAANKESPKDPAKVARAQTKLSGANAGVVSVNDKSLASRMDLAMTQDALAGNKDTKNLDNLVADLNKEVPDCNGACNQADQATHDILSVRGHARDEEPKSQGAHARHCAMGCD